MFTFSEKYNYHMPAHFGGYAGAAPPAAYHDVTLVMIRYETDRDLLERYVPAPFALRDPVLSVSFNMNRGVDWMAGGGYKLVAVDCPVTYRHGGEDLEGSFALVVWESKSTPCFPGREITGIPKVFGDIADFHQLGERMFSQASYEGTTFLEMDFEKKRRLTPPEVEAINQMMQTGTYRWFGWRYIPNIGKPGAALSHATLYPQDFTFRELYEGAGRIDWKAVTWEQNPTQAHIINALGRLPVKRYRECLASIGGSTVLRGDLARQLP